MVNPQAARKLIDIRLEKLRAMTYAQLSGLPATTIEAVPFGSDDWSVTTYVEPELPGSIRVVVQIGPSVQPSLLLLRVQADGFRMAFDGSWSSLSDRELYEFM